MMQNRMSILSLLNNAFLPKAKIQILRLGAIVLLRKEVVEMRRERKSNLKTFNRRIYQKNMMITILRVKTAKMRIIR